MPEQLQLPLPPHRQYRPLKAPACPCCKQVLESPDASLVVWQSLRDWLVLNWDWSAREILRELIHHPGELSLAEHPDLLWGLKAEAGYRELELRDCLAEIVDGYLQGEFNTIKRRGRKLKLPKPSCVFCAASMHQESDKCWRCEVDQWHSLHIDPALPTGFQGVWITRTRRDHRAGPGPLPVWLPSLS